MNRKELRRVLEGMAACKEALDWFDNNKDLSSLRTVWKSCNRPSWLFWLLIWSKLRGNWGYATRVDNLRASIGLSIMASRCQENARERGISLVEMAEDIRDVFPVPPKQVYAILNSRKDSHDEQS